MDELFDGGVRTYDVEAFARFGFYPFSVDIGFVMEEGWISELMRVVSVAR